MDFPDYYGVLGLPRFYPTQEEIRDAFLKKVVELNASGEANPDVRQALDSAYVTLSDAQKKREYDEVLDRYVQAEMFAPEKVVVSAYDYKDVYTEKRTVSMLPLSKKIYDFLSEKIRELAEISARYPFTTEMDREQDYFFEISMLILYSHFSFVYSEDYSCNELLQFFDDIISLMSLNYPVDDSEFIKTQFISEFRGILDNLEKSAEKPEDEDIFDYISIMYIFYTSGGSEIRQKIEQPGFKKAFISMKRELNDFWEKFYSEKEFLQ